VKDIGMSDLIKRPIDISEGEIVAENISVEDYFTLYTDAHYEWVQGVVIKMSPNSEAHNFLVDYFYDLVRAYLKLRPIGKAKNHTFAVHLTNSVREPDVFVVLHTNPNQLTPTKMLGAPDLCIEVVSPESAGRDNGTKLSEYEAAGVQEYWIADPLHRQATFYRLQVEGHYLAIPLDNDQNFTSLVLPNLKVHVPGLWQENLPDMSDLVELLRETLE
jgi:Uma2 family endonuclease